MSPQHVSPQCRTAVVIGAGIVGLASALCLQRRGVRCVLVDPRIDAWTSASYGNAGHLAVEQVAPLASWATIRSAPRRLFLFGGALDVRELRHTWPWLLQFVRAAAPRRFDRGRVAMRGLLARALPAWRGLLGDLGRDDLLRTDGHVVLWETPAAVARGRAQWRAAEIGEARIDDLDAQALSAYADALGHRPAGGIRFEGTGQLADVAGVLDALRDAFRAAGGIVSRQTATDVSIHRRKASVALESGEVIVPDALLIAAGAASGELLASAGLRVPLIAERGYHLHWTEHDWPASMTPTVFEDRSVILTRFTGGLRLAGFVEFARTSTPPDPRKWDALRRHARALGLPVRGEARTWFGARPTLPDYLPAIGRVRGADNLLYAFGHQHLGVTLAAITAEIVTALALDADSDLPLAPFDIGRFAGSDGDDAGADHRNDHDYDDNNNHDARPA